MTEQILVRLTKEQRDLIDLAAERINQGPPYRGGSVDVWRNLMISLAEMIVYYPDKLQTSPLYDLIIQEVDHEPPKAT